MVKLKDLLATRLNRVGEVFAVKMKRLGRLASRPAVSLFSTPKLWACSLARHCSSAPAASRVPAVTLLPGDGIGREIAAAVMRVFEVAGSPVEWEVVDEFAQPQEDGEMVIRPEAIASIQRNGVCLKGAWLDVRHSLLRCGCEWFVLCPPDGQLSLGQQRAVYRSLQHTQRCGPRSPPPATSQRPEPVRERAAGAHTARCTDALHGCRHCYNP